MKSKTPKTPSKAALAAVVADPVVQVPLSVAAEVIELPRLDGQSALTLKVETITPEVAEQYLTKNTNNRRPSPNTIRSYARDMKAGRWHMTVDAIRFDTTGKLIDGQQRLMACVIAETPFTTLVAYEVPDIAVNVIDSGRPRRASDILRMRQVSHHYALAATARNMLVIKSLMDSPRARGQMGTKFSNEELLDVVDRHPLLLESVTALQNPRPLGIRPSLLATTHYIGKHLLEKPEIADAFALAFTRGEAYWTENDPAIKLREYNMRQDARDLMQKDRAAFISVIYIWNAFAKGQSVHALKFPEYAAFDGLKLSQI